MRTNQSLAPSAPPSAAWPSNHKLPANSPAPSEGDAGLVIVIYNSATGPNKFSQPLTVSIFLWDRSHNDSVNIYYSVICERISQMV